MGLLEALLHATLNALLAFTTTLDIWFVSPVLTTALPAISIPTA